MLLLDQFGSQSAKNAHRMYYHRYTPVYIVGSTTAGDYVSFTWPYYHFPFTASAHEHCFVYPVCTFHQNRICVHRISTTRCHIVI